MDNSMMNGLGRLAMGNAGGIPATRPQQPPTDPREGIARALMEQRMMGSDGPGGGGSLPGVANNPDTWTDNAANMAAAGLNGFMNNKRRGDMYNQDQARIAMLGSDAGMGMGAPRKFFDLSGLFGS